jgi:hypothetical protein
MTAMVHSLEDVVRRRVIRYFQCTDEGSWDEWAELVTEDFEIDANGYLTTGRQLNLEAIRRLHGPALPEGRHLVTNILVDFAESAAVVRCDWIWIAEIGVPYVMSLATLSMGRSSIEFTLIDNAWVIRSLVSDIALLPHATEPAAHQGLLT